MTILKSSIDSSINYLFPTKDGGKFEARFVQRDPSYFIVYLSSHSGCNQACKFCHLTQLKETTMLSASLDDYLAQARRVLETVDWDQQYKLGLRRVKYSFMARGEALLNTTVQQAWSVLRLALKSLIPSWVSVEFSISTIFPKSYDYELNPLHALFTTPDVTLYCSIYSTNPVFRKKWLGNALGIEEIRDVLQQYTGTIKFHSAFIKGQNDSEKDIKDLKHFIESLTNNTITYNIVRYNPFDSKYSESENIHDIQNTMDAKVIKRVGFDVKASCGMFV